MTWILLELPEPEALQGPEAPALGWLRLRPNGTPLEHGCDTPEALHQRIARGDRVLALVPGERAPLYRVDLPPGSARARREALPYALEDRLSEDLKALHFAAEFGRGTQVTAAVVAHRDLEQWRNWLEVHKLGAAALVPDIGLLRGWAPADTTLVLAGTRRSLILQPGSEPLALPPELLDWWLQAHASPPPDFDGEADDARDGNSPPPVQIEGNPPSSLTASAAAQPRRGEPALPGDWDGSVTTLLNVSCSADAGRARQLSRALRNIRRFNLAAHADNPGTAPSALLHSLKRPAVLAAAVGLAWLATLWLEVHQTERELQRTEQAIEDIFERALPGTRLVDPVAQFRNVLERGGDPDPDSAAVSPLGERLAAAATTFDNDAVTLRSLRGDTGRLEIELETDSVQRLEQLRERLHEAAGQPARITQAETGDDRVRGRILLEANGQ
ncbi:MAG: type II secretion system protein GspL [Pseudomonadota bacterium]